jgi:putative SOS response-associated peptidase YedK
MCARFNLFSNPYELAQIFELLREPDWSPRYNIAPAQTTLVIRQAGDGTRLASPLKWGLVPPTAKNLIVGSQMVNARAESAAIKPSFANAFRERRCIIPANGFYEWEVITKKVKQPWNMSHSNQEILALAGLWESWHDPEEDTTLETFTILTTAANQFMSEIHDRMPVILSKPAWTQWLNPEIQDVDVLNSLLVPAPEDWLVRVPVGGFVNSTRNDSVECIKPVKPSKGLF